MKRFIILWAVIFGLAIFTRGQAVDSVYDSQATGYEAKPDSIAGYNQEENSEADYKGIAEVVETVESEEVNDSTGYEIAWPEYDAWRRVSIDGKFKMQGLPISPSMKIFMQKDSLVDVSLRAPFVGEAGRLILTPDSLLIVNKLNKTYVSAGGDANSDMVKMLIGMAQDLILGRFFLPGHDVMTEDLNELVDIYYEGDGQFNVVPKESAKISGVKYGFTVDEEFNPLMLVVLPEGREDIEVDAIYSRGLKGYDVRVAYQDGQRTMEAVLELKEPAWETQPPKEFELGKKYRQVSIEEFIRFR